MAVPSTQKWEGHPVTHALQKLWGLREGVQAGLLEEGHVTWASKDKQHLEGLAAAPWPIHLQPHTQPPLPDESGQGFPGSWGEGGQLWCRRFPSHRIHAEFQLSEPPDFPFWFSPGQFTGHIILSKDATHVRDFRLFVPNHRWELDLGPALAPSYSLSCSPAPGA